MSEQIPERAVRLADGRVLRYPSLPYPCTYFSVIDPKNGQTTTWPSERWDSAPVSLLVAVLLGSIRQQELGVPLAVGDTIASDAPSIAGDVFAHETVVADAASTAIPSASASSLSRTSQTSTLAPPAPGLAVQKEIAPPPATSKASPLFTFVKANAFALAGVGMVLVGLSFLFPLLIQNGFFPPVARVSLGFIFGLVVAVFGWTQKASRRDYSLTAQGGGFAIMYLSVYAAHRAYALIGSSTAFVSFFILAATLFGLAIGSRALAMAVIGMIGAYLAPILVAESGAPLEVPLIYTFFLAVGCMLASSRTGWRSLNAVSLAASMILSLEALAASALSPPIGLCEALLVGYLLLYSMEPVMLRLVGYPAISTQQRAVDAALTYVPAPVIAYLFTCLPGASPDAFRNALGAEALWFAALWFFNRATMTSFAKDFGRISLLLGTLALSVWVPHRQLTVLYAVEGVALCYLGVDRAAGVFVSVFGLLLRGISFFAVLLLIDAHDSLMTAVVAGYFSAATAFFFAFSRTQKTTNVRGTEFVAGLAWSYAAFFGIPFVHRLNDLSLLAAIASYTAALALLLHLLSRVAGWLESQGALRYVLICAQLALLGLFVLPGPDGQVVIAANFGVAFLLVASAYISLMNADLDRSLRFANPGTIHIAMALLLSTELIAVILREDNRQIPLWAIFGGDALVGTTVTLIWGLIGLAAATFGARQQHYRKGGMMLLAVAGGKLILFDMSQAGTLARVVSFIGLGGLYLLVGALAPKAPIKLKAEAETPRG